MARVFKKSVVRYLDAAGKQVPKGTAGAKKHKEKSAKWYGRVPGAAKPVPLCANKTAAQMLLNELVKKAEMARAGICDPYEAHRKRPLAEHLDDFRREMESKGDDPRHVSITISRLRALLSGCGFVFMADTSASRVMDWLANLRRERAVVVLPPAIEWFTPREAAGLLGIKTASVGAAVRRQRLDAQGQGRARLFPRATVEALQERFSRGASIETTNQYLTHIKAFTRWLVRDHRTDTDPLTHLESGNSQTDRRHDRRELEA
jgi:integrase/recombinase XerC